MVGADLGAAQSVVVILFGLNCGTKYRMEVPCTYGIQC